MKFVTSVSLDSHQVEKLKTLCARTGLTRSEVVRLLIDSAEIAPPVPAKVRTARLPKPPRHAQLAE